MEKFQSFTQRITEDFQAGKKQSVGEENRLDSGAVSAERGRGKRKESARGEKRREKGRERANFGLSFQTATVP